MQPSVEAAPGNNPGSEPFLDFLARDTATTPLNAGRVFRRTPQRAVCQTDWVQTEGLRLPQASTASR